MQRLVGNRSLILALLAALLSCPMVGRAWSQEEPPAFKGFSVSQPFKGKPAPVRLSSRQARKFRTVLTRGTKKGPNFAGQYTIVTWGCGASCIEFAIIDARTGNVYFPPFYVAYGSALKQEKLVSRGPLEFRRDSRLLIVTGSRNERGEGVYYYKWEKNRLRLIASRFEAR